MCVNIIGVTSLYYYYFKVLYTKETVALHFNANYCVLLLRKQQEIDGSILRWLYSWQRT